MSKLPRDLPGDRLIRALSRAGWYRDLTLRHRDVPGKKLVVPVHPGRPLKPKVLHRILREAGLTIQQLRDLL